MSAYDAAAVTKARAMSGKLLTEADFAELARYDTVGGAASWLALKPVYADAMNGADTAHMNRVRLEYRLENSLLSRMSRLRRFTNGTTRLVIDRMLAKYECRYLLLILRGLMFRESKTSPERLNDALIIPPPLAEMSRLDFTSLMSSSDTHEFLDNLSGSEYADVFSDAVNSRADYTMIETAVLRYYYSSFYAAAEKLGGRDGDKLCAMLRAAMLEANVGAASRLRGFVSSDEGEKLLLAPISKQDAASLRAIIDSADSANAAALGEPMKKRATALRKSSKPEGAISALTIVAYLLLAEAETARIVKTVENIRYR